jgi:hypothetical protein
MRRHLWTLVLGGLLSTFVLSSNAQAWHFKKPACPPTPTCAPAPQCPPAPECPPKEPCLQKYCHPTPKCNLPPLFPPHKSCLACPEHVKPPCIVSLCPAPAPPCPPVVFLSSPQASSQWVAPAPQAPSKQAY